MQLAKERAVRGATVPRRSDPLWQHLASPQHLRCKTESTWRQLHPAGEPRSVEGTAESVHPEALT